MCGRMYTFMYTCSRTIQHTPHTLHSTHTTLYTHYTLHTLHSTHTTLYTHYTTLGHRVQPGSDPPDHWQHRRRHQWASDVPLEDLFNVLARGAGVFGFVVCVCVCVCVCVNVYVTTIGAMVSIMRCIWIINTHMYTYLHIPVCVQWVLTFDWVVEACLNGALAKEEDFLVSGDLECSEESEGPRRSRLAHTTKLSDPLFHETLFVVDPDVDLLAHAVNSSVEALSVADVEALVVQGMVDACVSVCGVAGV
jgi:hypothetical protein